VELRLLTLEAVALSLRGFILIFKVGFIELLRLYLEFLITKLLMFGALGVYCLICIRGIHYLEERMNRSRWDALWK
jgi:hypothetical protein